MRTRRVMLVAVLSVLAVAMHPFVVTLLVYAALKTYGIDVELLDARRIFRLDGVLFNISSLCTLTPQLGLALIVPVLLSSISLRRAISLAIASYGIVTALACARIFIVVASYPHVPSPLSELTTVVGVLSLSIAFVNILSLHDVLSNKLRI